MSCENYQMKLSDYLDKNLSEDESAELTNHIQRCETCAQELDSLKLILAEASSLEKAKAPAGLWEKIESELDAPKPALFAFLSDKIYIIIRKIESYFSIPVPAIVLRVAVVAALIFAGVGIDRYFIPGLVDQDVAQDKGKLNIDYQMVNYRTAEYIEKSKILLLGIVNLDFESAEQMDLKSEKRIAGQLVKEASFIRENLPHRRNERIRQLVSDLELILLEIANLEEQEDLRDVELIKSGIDSKSLLLQISLHDISDEQVKPISARDTDNL